GPRRLAPADGRARLGRRPHPAARRGRPAPRLPERGPRRGPPPPRGHHDRGRRRGRTTGTARPLRHRQRPGLGPVPLMSPDRAALVQAFLDDAEERIGRMEEALHALHGTPDHPRLVEAILRDARSLRGGAASLGFVALAASAGAMEEALDRLQEDGTHAPGAILRLLDSVDPLRHELVAAAMAPTTE